LIIAIADRLAVAGEAFGSVLVACPRRLAALQCGEACLTVRCLIPLTRLRLAGGAASKSEKYLAGEASLTALEAASRIADRNVRADPVANRTSRGSDQER
jgi:hypothetical protein